MCVCVPAVSSCWSAVTDASCLHVWVPVYSLPISVSALAVWRATSLNAWLPVWSPVCLCHLWVLVVSWHGWPMSLWVGDEPGLKYSSAVSAAGLVTAGHDIWVTRACRKGRVNFENPDIAAILKLFLIHDSMSAVRRRVLQRFLAFTTDFLFHCLLWI